MFTAEEEAYRLGAYLRACDWHLEQVNRLKSVGLDYSEPQRRLTAWRSIYRGALRTYSAEAILLHASSLKRSVIP